MHLGNPREPLAAEQLLEDRTRELRLPLVQVGPVVRIRNAVTAAVRSEQCVDRPHAGYEELPERRDVVEARFVEQRLVVTRRQCVTPLVVDLEDAGRRLLLEPLADVALVEARGFGQLLGGRRAAVCECPVEPEAHTEVDGEHVHRAERRAEEPLDESVAPHGGLVAATATLGVDLGLLEACPSSRRRSTSTR